MRIRTFTLAALAAGSIGLAGLSVARAETPTGPDADAAARQKFVALLTSVKPAAKAPETAVKGGSLQAFIGPVAATPIRGTRGR